MRVMQDRKGVSIAFFNATNSAIAMLTADKINMTSSEMEAYITKWRNWFLDEYQNYHKTVIQSVGANYKAEDTIKRVEAVTTMQELSNLWKILSEDERHDGEIRKVVQSKRDSFK